MSQRTYFAFVLLFFSLGASATYKKTKASKKTCAELIEVIIEEVEKTPNLSRVIKPKEPYTVRVYPHFAQSHGKPPAGPFILGTRFLDPDTPGYQEKYGTMAPNEVPVDQGVLVNVRTGKEHRASDFVKHTFAWPSGLRATSPSGMHLMSLPLDPNQSRAKDFALYYLDPKDNGLRPITPPVLAQDARDVVSDGGESYVRAYLGPDGNRAFVSVSLNHPEESARFIRARPADKIQDFQTLQYWVSDSGQVIVGRGHVDREPRIMVWKINPAPAANSSNSASTQLILQKDMPIHLEEPAAVMTTKVSLSPLAVSKKGNFIVGRGHREVIKLVQVKEKSLREMKLGSAEELTKFLKTATQFSAPSVYPIEAKFSPNERYLGVTYEYDYEIPPELRYNENTAERRFVTARWDLNDPSSPPFIMMNSGAPRGNLSPEMPRSTDFLISDDGEIRLAGVSANYIFLKTSSGREALIERGPEASSGTNNISFNDNGNLIIVEQYSKLVVYDFKQDK